MHKYETYFLASSINRTFSVEYQRDMCKKKKNPSAYEAKMFRIQYSWAANFQHSRKNVPYFQPSEELAVRTRLTPELMLFPRFDRHRILCDHWCTPDRGSIFPGVRLSTSARNK